MATLQDFDGNFLFCRLLFQNAADGDGDGWHVDYPRADINLTFTKTTVTRDPDDGYFLQFAPEGYAFAVNAFVYSMTH